MRMKMSVVCPSRAKKKAVDAFASVFLIGLSAEYFARTRRADRYQGSRVRGVRGVAPPPAEGATRGKRLCPLEFDPETSSTTISFSPKRVHQSLLSCRPFFCLPMSHRNDPFYAHLRAVLTVYADTEHPDVDVAANFRRDLVQAWTTHSLPEMLVPTETATKLHGEVIDALVELKDELETKAHANNNASESVAQCLVCALMVVCALIPFSLPGLIKGLIFGHYAGSQKTGLGPQD